jgi:hypothetical protein
MRKTTKTTTTITMFNYNRGIIPSSTNSLGYSPMTPTTIINNNNNSSKRLSTWIANLSITKRVGIVVGMVMLLWTALWSGDRNPPNKTMQDNQHQQNHQPDPTSNPKQTISVATWNIGAINNNPFEYWLTMEDDPNYESILTKVEAFVQNPPTKKDVEVSFIFTQQMYDTLRQEMIKLKWDNLDVVDRLWQNDWSKRKIVTEFLKDSKIGLKRLVSMPDRMTNTIISSTKTYYRPTAVNCYPEKMTSIADWYSKWITFMFHTSLQHKDNKTPAQILERIPRAKYPALTEEEERVSVPLQTLVIAIFDAIQVRMLNQLSGQDTWQLLRNRICQELNTKKTKNTLDLILKTYSDIDVFMLQETAAVFVQDARQHPLNEIFHIIIPKKLGKNDQNSLVLLRKTYFPSPITKELAITVNPAGMVSDGDLFVFEVNDYWSRKFTLASFHGDTNGLATIPVVTAVLPSVSSSSSNSRLLFGLDANTYFKKKSNEKVQDVEGFMASFTSLGLTSVWGNTKIPPHTTKNARTYMQPQLSKAASRGEIEEKGDQNPKDFILFSPNKFSLVESSVVRDNLGKKEFDEELVFPTLAFPSDHAVLSAILNVL